MKTLNSGDVVSVSGWSGIAFYVRGPALNDTEGVTIRVVMVGDDREHVVDADDCTPLEDGRYCTTCGQIGCHYGC